MKKILRKKNTIFPDKPKYIEPLYESVNGEPFCSSTDEDVFVYSLVDYSNCDDALIRGYRKEQLLIDYVNKYSTLLKPQSSYYRYIININDVARDVANELIVFFPKERILSATEFLFEEEETKETQISIDDLLEAEKEIKRGLRAEADILEDTTSQNSEEGKEPIKVVKDWTKLIHDFSDVEIYALPTDQEKNEEKLKKISGEILSRNLPAYLTFAILDEINNDIISNTFNEWATEIIESFLAPYVNEVLDNISISDKLLEEFYLGIVVKNVVGQIKNRIPILLEETRREIKKEEEKE